MLFWKKPKYIESTTRNPKYRLQSIIPDWKGADSSQSLTEHCPRPMLMRKREDWGENRPAAGARTATWPQLPELCAYELPRTRELRQDPRGSEDSGRPLKPLEISKGRRWHAAMERVEREQRRAQGIDRWYQIRTLGYCLQLKLNFKITILSLLLSNKWRQNSNGITFFLNF